MRVPPGKDRLSELPSRPLPTYVRSRDGSVQGVTTGRTYRCRLEGCRGRRIEVRWPDGTITRPCSDGMMVIQQDTWQIL